MTRDVKRGDFVSRHLRLSQVSWPVHLRLPTSSSSPCSQHLLLLRRRSRRPAHPLSSRPQPSQQRSQSSCYRAIRRAHGAAPLPGSALALAVLVVNAGARSQRLYECARRGPVRHLSNPCSPDTQQLHSYSRSVSPASLTGPARAYKRFI